jgi:hypothetical protein
MRTSRASRPYRSIASTRTGTSGRCRLRQILSEASQTRNRRRPGAQAAGRTPIRLTRAKQPHRLLAVKAGNSRRELLEDPAPLDLSACEYRPTIDTAARPAPVR